jgi:hypothetical protein
MVFYKLPPKKYNNFHSMMDYEYGNGLSTQKKEGNKINVPHAIVPLTIKQVLGLSK